MKPSLRIAAATVLLLWGAAALAQDAIGVVKRTRGPAVIERAGEQLPAARGTPLQHGDRIVTGAKAYVDITMRGAALSVGPQADVSLDRFAPEQPQSAQSVPPILQGLASLLSINRAR